MPKTKVRVPQERMDQIRNEYFKGGVSIRELAELHHVNFYTLRNRALQEKWTSGRCAEGQIFDRALEAKLTQKASTIAESAARLRERQAEQGWHWLSVLDKCIEDVQARRDPDAVNRLVNAWARVVEVQRNCFGMDIVEKQPVIKVSLDFNVVDLSESRAIDVPSETLGIGGESTRGAIT